MPALLIAEECRDYLVAQGLVKKPATVSGSAPKCYVEPLTGAPSPEEAGTNLTLRYAGGLPSPSYGEFGQSRAELGGYGFELRDFFESVVVDSGFFEPF